MYLINLQFIFATSIICSVLQYSILNKFYNNIQFFLLPVQMDCKKPVPLNQIDINISDVLLKLHLIKLWKFMPNGYTNGNNSLQMLLIDEEVISTLFTLIVYSFFYKQTNFIMLITNGLFIFLGNNNSSECYPTILISI